MMAMIRRTWERFKRGIMWFFIGGIALAGTTAVIANRPVDTPIQDNEASVIETVAVPTHFAEIDAQGNVLRVIVADQAFIDSGAVGEPTNWVQTYRDESKRGNYAGKGHSYDKQRDMFISPKPKGDVVLDEKTGKWKKRSI